MPPKTQRATFEAEHGPAWMKTLHTNVLGLGIELDVYSWPNLLRSGREAKRHYPLARTRAAVLSNRTERRNMSGFCISGEIRWRALEMPCLEICNSLVAFIVSMIVHKSNGPVYLNYIRQVVYRSFRYKGQP